MTATTPAPTGPGDRPGPERPGPDGTGPEGGGAPRRPRWVAPVVVGAVGAAGCAAVALWNPGDGGTPLCWSQGLFGVDCPLCGGLRCTNALLRGDWSAAADHNVLLAVALPVAAVLWVVWLVRSLQDRPMPEPVRRVLHPPGPALVGLGVLLLAFSVVRNVDGGPAWVTWLHSTTYLG